MTERGGRLEISDRGSPNDGQTNLTFEGKRVFIQIHSQNNRMSSRCSKRLIRKGSERRDVTLNNAGGY